METQCRQRNQVSHLVTRAAFRQRPVWAIIQNDARSVGRHLRSFPDLKTRCVQLLKWTMSRRSASEIMDRIGNWLRSRRLVGVDEAGNRYYEAYQGSGLPLRRYRERARRSSWFSLNSRGDYAGEGADSINILWWQWLVGVRAGPPTAEELASLQRQQLQLRERVAKLAEQELAAKERDDEAVSGARARPEVWSSRSQQLDGRAQVTPVSAASLLATGSVHREWTTTLDRKLSKDGKMGKLTATSEANQVSLEEEAKTLSGSEPPIWVSNRRRPRS
jgi:NADH:ubiquinone oxidoreductase subunit